MPTLLVGAQSRSGTTAQLRDAFVAGAREPEIEGVDGVVRNALDARAADVVTCDGVAIITPEHFGSMAGLMKDFFERIFSEIVDTGRSLPYALVVKGNHDGTGTVEGVQKLAVALHWRRVLDPVVAIGELTDAHREAAHELGATFAAGMAATIF